MNRRIGRVVFAAILFCASMPAFGVDRQLAFCEYIRPMQLTVNLTGADAIYSTGNIVYYRGAAAKISVGFINSYLFTNDSTMYEGRVIAYNRNNQAIASVTASSISNSNFVPPENVYRIYASINRYNIWYEKETFLFFTTKIIKHIQYVESVSAYIYLSHDPAGPDLQVSGGDQLVNTATALISASAADTVSGLDTNSWRYTVNSGPERTGKEVTLREEGDHTVTFSVRDNVGNLSSQTVQVMIDRTSPVVSAEGSSGQWTNTDVTVLAQADEGLSGIEPATWRCSLDGGLTWSEEAEENNSVTLRENGVYEVRFTVQDRAGNRSAYSKAVTVKIDKIIPVINLENGMKENDWSNEISRVLRAVVSDTLSGPHILETTNAWGDWQQASQANQSAMAFTGEGSFTWRVRAADLAGNINTAMGIVNLDRRAPLVSGFEIFSLWVKPDHVFSGVRITDSTEATSRISGIDPNSFAVILEGAGSIPVKTGYNQVSGSLSPFTVPGLREGIYNISLSVSDRAGNRGSSRLTLIRVDGTAPVLSGSLAGPLRRTGDLVSIPIRVRLAESELSGMDPDAWRYAIDGGEKKPLLLFLNDGSYSGDVQVEALSRGSHSLTVSAADRAGNPGAFTLNFDFDNQPPVITWDNRMGKSPETAVWTGAPLWIRAEDDGGTVTSLTVETRLRERNSFTPLGSEIFDGSMLSFRSDAPDGLYQVVIRARDDSNNAVEEVIYAALDRNGPVVELRGIAGGGAEMNSPGEISAGAADAFSGVDANSWEWRSGEGLWRRGSTALLAEGKNQRLSFRVRDKVGNETLKTVVVTVDPSPPELSFSAPRYAAGGPEGGLNVNLNVRDTISGISSAWYRIDGGPEQFVDFREEALYLSLDGFSEGLHTLSFGAKNGAGLSASASAWTFYIDGTAPEVLDVTLLSMREPGLILGDVTSESRLRVRVTARDQRLEGEALREGEIAACYWDLRDSPADNPRLPEERRVTAQEFEISLLRDGPHYLYIWAADAASNVSPSFLKLLTVDRSVPGAPGIQSSTHREATRPGDAEALGLAEFSFTPPVPAHIEIKQYFWRLERIVIAGGAEGRAETAAQGRVEAVSPGFRGTLSLDLDDNAAQEFYRLRVSCAGYNDLSGQESLYQFRVDRTPPEKLRLSVSPQAEAEDWYNARHALVTWDTPADMKDVSEYRWRMAAGDFGEEELSWESTAGWSRITGSELNVDLRLALGQDGAGPVTVTVCAPDHAGILRWGSAVIRCDFGAPVFDTPEAGGPSVEGSGAERVIRWGILRDAGSGPASITLILQAESGAAAGETRTLVLEPETEEYLAPGLAGDALYTALIRGTDLAGNQTELYAAFVTGDGEMPGRFTVPYHETIEGYGISGQRVVIHAGEGAPDEELEGLLLEIPESLELYEVLTLDGVDTRRRIRSLALEDADTEHGIFRAGRSAAARYEARAEGFTVSGSRVVFDRENGAALFEALYTRSFAGEEAVQVSLGSVSLGYPPRPRLSGGPGSTGGPKSLETLSEGPQGERVPGFTLRGIESLRLASGEEWFDDAAFDSSPLAAWGMELRGNEGPDIRLRESRVQAGNGNVRGLLDIERSGPVTLTLQGTDYAVKTAGIRGGSVVIYEAVLSLPEGYEPRELVLRNFTLDGTSGLVLAGDDFTAERIYCSTDPWGHNFESLRIEFDSSGTLRITGNLYSETLGRLRLDWTALTGEGIDWNAGISIRSFTALVHGFPVSTEEARFGPDGIVIPRGRIALQGGERAFTNLLLHPERHTVLAGGVMQPWDWEGPYGNIRVSGGFISPDGVGGSISAPLGAGIRNGEGGTSLELPVIFDSRLGPRGILHGPLDLNVGGFDIAAEGLVFNGASIETGTLHLETAAGILSFSGLKFNGERILEAALCPGVTYILDGWQIGFDELRLDGRGVYGKAVVEMPPALGDFPLIFPGFVMRPDGAFESGGVADQYNDITLWDSVLRLPGAELVSREGTVILACTSPLMQRSFYFGLDPESPDAGYGTDLRFGPTGFDSGGMVVYGGEGPGPFRFLSSNEYIVEGDSCLIDNEGLWLRGSLSTRWWDGAQVPAGGRGIRILPYFVVSAEAPEESVDYQYEDWIIRGKGINFAVDSITIESNITEYREIPVELGPLEYTVNGYLAYTAQRYQDREFSIVPGLEIRLMETAFNSGGLFAVVLVTLPAPWESISLPFEADLKPNGKFHVSGDLGILEAELGGFSFQFRRVSFDNHGVYISSVLMQMPESMDGAVLELSGVTLSRNRISVASESIPAVNIWGMEFWLRGFSLESGVISLTGGVRLPWGLPGSLRGKRLEIEKFEIDLDGGIRAFEVNFPERCYMPLGDAWGVSINGVSIRYMDSQIWMLLNNCSLLFPGGFIIDKASIDQARFNFSTGEFDFASLSLDTNIEVIYGRLKFRFSKMAVDSKLTFSFAGSLEFPDNLPRFIAGKTVEIDTFEINRDGSIGNIAVRLSGIEGEIIPGSKSLLLRRGSVSLARGRAGSLIITVGGDLILTSDMPGSLAGAVLAIDSLEIDPGLARITRLEATAHIARMDIFGSSFTGLGIGLFWDGEDGEVRLTGTMEMPASFPASLAGRSIAINEFAIGFDGKIRSFSARFSGNPNEEFQILDLITVSRVSISVSYLSESFEFDLGGRFTLPAGKFPQGIGGTSLEGRARLDAQRGIKTLSAEAEFPNLRLFNVMETRGLRINLSKEEGLPGIIMIRGSMILPNHFPASLRGISLNINRFVVNTNGAITDFDVALSGVTIDIFSGVKLQGGFIQGRMGKENEVVINVGGKLVLTAPGLPASLRGLALVIRSMELSSLSGLRSFEAGIEAGKPFSFYLFGGIRIDINSLFISESSITLDSSAVLPESYPAGLSNTRIDLKVLKIGWDGSILDIQGGIGAMTLDIAGFNARIDSLLIERLQGRTYITLASCRIILPEAFGALGSGEVGIRNARICLDDGSFSGDLAISTLAADIAGFRLELFSPALEFTSRCMTFEQAKLYTPDFLGNASIALSKLKLSAARGVEFEGGTFNLPGFKLGNLSFINISAEFRLSEGDYLIGARGGVTIPGAGTIGASMIFARKSSLYPIGLRQAEFSWEAAFGGIPLGPSGLFISGIAGGITYGSPTEVPARVRGLFYAGGPRIKLGLTLRDAATSGGLIQMWPTVWVDINNGAWAFQGRAAIFSGTLNIGAEATAALSSRGFYAGAEINIKFVRGGVEVYIFDKSGRTIFSGEGYVQFGLPRGSIVDTTVLFVPIVVPWGDLWLPSVNAAFGRFTNGRTGFKGWVNVPILGSIGIYVGSGGITLGNVSSYTLERPDWAAPVNLRASPEAGDPNILYRDREDAADKGDYVVMVPEPLPGRLVLLLAFTEGDPSVTAVSPSGRVFQEGDDGTELVLLDNVYALIVNNPEAGQWRLQVHGAAAGDYNLSVLGPAPMPSLELTGPNSGLELSGGSFIVRGAAGSGVTGIRISAHELPGMPGFELGVFPLEGGDFELEVAAEEIADGDYYISAELLLNDETVTPPAYAPGRIRLDRSAVPLLEPEPLRISETDPGTLTLRWNRNNGGRDAGFLVEMSESEREEPMVLDAGNVTLLSLSGFQAGSIRTFRVLSYDEARRESPWTNPRTVVLGAEAPPVNRPEVETETLRISGVPGALVQGAVAVRVLDFKDTWDSAGWFIARQAEGQEPEGFFFEGPVRAEGRRVEIPFSLYIPAAFSAGTYRYPCEVVNESNRSLRAAFTVELEVEWPMPVLHRVYPNRAAGNQEERLMIYGAGFVPGTRVFFREKELALETAQGWNTEALEVLLPPQNAAGEYNLTVTGPGGASASIPLALTMPDWYARIFTGTAVTVPGGTAVYHIGVNGYDGFSGSVAFTASRKDNSISVSAPVIQAGRTGFISITTAAGIAPGTYITEITGGGSKTFELVTVVEEKKPAPHLSSLFPAAVYAGAEVHIYGYALGSRGEVMLRGMPVMVLSWSDSEIVAKIPQNAESGMVGITMNGEKSNELPLIIRNRGFTLRPGLTAVELEEGETQLIDITVRGYPEKVSLGVVVEPGAPFTAALRSDSAVPNAVLSLELSAAETSNAANGYWKVQITGQCGSYQGSAEITVSLMGRPEITTGESLPAAWAESTYYARLESRNLRGEGVYELAYGELPPGLTLNRRGEIQGSPLRTGSYEIAITVTDPLTRRGLKFFTLEVREEVWGQSGRDGGLSRASGMELPANRESFFGTMTGNEVRVLVAAEEQIAVIGREGLTALHYRDGSVSWNVEGAYRDAKYAGGFLYALREDGILEGRDLGSGNLLWQREGIRSITSDGNTIFAESGGTVLVLNGSLGVLTGEFSAGGYDSESVLWMNGAAFSLSKTGAAAVYGASLSFEAGSPILAAAADALGMILVTEGGVVLLDQDFREAARLETPFTGPVSIALSAEAVLVSAEDGLTIYSRDGLVPLRRWDEAGSLQVAAGKDRLFTLNGEGFALRNLHEAGSGGLLWEEAGDFTAYAFYRGSVYAATADGLVSAFGGEPNTGAPETSILLDPPDPEGRNGWYVTAPELSITAFDRDSYVSEIKAWLDDSEFDAAEKLRLEDGEHQIAAFGVDSHGLAGATVRKTVRIDTDPPDSDISISDDPPDSGWYGAPVTVTLEGWDSGSGFDRIETSLGRYIDPIVISRGGKMNFTWYALDRAGNREGERSLEINIDYEPPYVDAFVLSDRGLGEITLQAGDAASGVRAVEYRINGGAVMPYREPLYVEAGRFLVSYRAVDYAGNYSAWQDCEAVIDLPWPQPVVIEDAVFNGLSRYVVHNLRNGLPVLRSGSAVPAPDRSKPEALINLPSYVMGAEYILWEAGDGEGEDGTIRFRAARNCVVYLFLDSREEANPSWTLIEEGLRINPVYYPGSRRVYMRRLPAGGVLEVASRGGNLPPFIAVHETGAITADIKLSKAEDDSPGFQGPGRSTEELRAGDTLTLAYTPTPWRYSRRLPLRHRWLVFINGGWEALQQDRYTIPDEDGGESGGFLRFRLEITAPDGQVEYRGEKTAGITAASREDAR
ncbi:MAG: hypothetical protein LBQ35_06535 [Spirochaetaceae bacterium]|jgi:hypothetical protein|nr:hypothetical protein [Spirochaetaceae bacterium]